MLCADIAQLVEHLIRNEGVVGSNPIIGSRKKEFAGFSASSFFILCPLCKVGGRRIDGG
jgi:hypothetical protein